MIYKSLGESGDREGDLDEMNSEKRLFLLLGVSLVGVGVCVWAFSACAHVRLESREVGRTRVDQSPIVVDYELPPYHVPLQHINYDSGEENFYNLDDEKKPLVDNEDPVKTFLVQDR